MPKLRRVGLAVVLLSVLGSALGGTTWDGCNVYWNSTLVSSWIYGTYCGSTGPGCEECYRTDDGSYCVARLPDRCGIRPQSPTRL
jgi:hypothetical protein